MLDAIPADAVLLEELEEGCDGDSTFGRTQEVVVLLVVLAAIVLRGLARYRVKELAATFAESCCQTETDGAPIVIVVRHIDMKAYHLAHTLLDVRIVAITIVAIGSGALCGFGSTGSFGLLLATLVATDEVGASPIGDSGSISNRRVAGEAKTGDVAACRVNDDAHLVEILLEAIEEPFMILGRQLMVGTEHRRVDGDDGVIATSAHAMRRIEDIGQTCKSVGDTIERLMIGVRLAAAIAQDKVVVDVDAKETAMMDEVGLRTGWLEQSAESGAWKAALQPIDTFTCAADIGFEPGDLLDHRLMFGANGYDGRTVFATQRVGFALDTLGKLVAISGEGLELFRLLPYRPLHRAVGRDVGSVTFLAQVHELGKWHRLTLIGPGRWIDGYRSVEIHITDEYVLMFDGCKYNALIRIFNHLMICFTTYFNFFKILS